jgi:hypothetical protein
MNRLIACVMMFGLIVWQVPVSAVNGNKAQYVGGTVSGLQDKAEGSLLTNDEVANDRANRSSTRTTRRGSPVWAASNRPNLKARYCTGE